MKRTQRSNAGCIQIMGSQSVGFPSSLSSRAVFAWLTCPAALERFKRDNRQKF